MLGKSAVRMVAACAVCLSTGIVARAQAVAEPPYVFLLRSREAEVTPERTKHAETGGGFIQVTQIAPNVVLFLMRGAVVAGEDHAARAAMQFKLEQDLEIMATRSGIRPPRLVAAAWLIGTLDSSLKNGGAAQQDAACATVGSLAGPIVNLVMKPHAVADGENLLVNERVGPMEALVAPGPYHLSQTFGISAMQGKGCHTGSAAAHFDPDPRLDTKWNEVLKPFRAVPKRDFGFRVILRVVEDVPPPDIAAQPPVEALPPPQPIPQTKDQNSTPPVLNGENTTR
jgi:hypothetical protein